MSDKPEDNTAGDKIIGKPGGRSRLEEAPQTLDIDSGSLGDLRVGSVEVRLARDEAEIRATQALRYKTFWEEHGNTPPSSLVEGLDVDTMDAHCDHLLVVDTDRPKAEQIVGSYRLVRREAADAHGGFYTAGEYDIENLLSYSPNILELGRSSVDIPYRTRPVMQLLWKGIASYLFHYNLDLLFGCASFFGGTDPKQHAMALSYLYHYHLTPDDLYVRTLPEFHAEMNQLPKDKVDMKQAFKDMPPLVKGYARLGAYFGDGAFIDREMKTVDVCVVLPTDNITEKYFRHYQRSTRDAWGKSGEESMEEAEN